MNKKKIEKLDRTDNTTPKEDRWGIHDDLVILGDKINQLVEAVNKLNEQEQTKSSDVVGGH